MKKLLLFGAGKIGRSFIGQLFSRGGYEVIFVDINQELIRKLNQDNSYNVIIKSDAGDTTLNIKNVRGLHFSQKKEILAEVCSTNLMATAVGSANLKTVIKIIGEGLLNKIGKGIDTPVDIIIAENLRNAAEFFHDELITYLPENYVRDRIGLVETSIGKMVPIMTKEELDEDILQVFAEPYNTLILDHHAFKNPLPQVEGLSPKKNMKAWVDRKSFIHNLGHAAAAYYGFLKHPDYKYLYEVLSDKEVFYFAESAMKESANILISIYPDEFNFKILNEHIRDLLKRFQNRSLGDTVYRVGRDLCRKLGPDDRLTGAIILALKTGNRFDRILYSLVCGFYFRAKDNDGKYYTPDRKFIRLFNNVNTEKMLEKVCKFNKYEHYKIFEKALKLNEEIINKFNINKALP